MRNGGKRKGVRTGDCPENGTRPFFEGKSTRHDFPPNSGLRCQVCHLHSPDSCHILKLRCILYVRVAQRRSGTGSCWVYICTFCRLFFVYMLHWLSLIYTVSI